MQLGDHFPIILDIHCKHDFNECILSHRVTLPKNSSFWTFASDSMLYNVVANILVHNALYGSLIITISSSM